MPQAVVAVQAFIYGTVGTAAASVGFSSAAAATIANAAVVVATATAKVALLAGLNAVVANQNKPRPQGGLINLTINPAEPRRLQVGKRINGGVLTDWYVGGAKNGELFMIVYLGEGPMGQITKVYGGGREVYSTPLVHGTRTEIPAYRSVGDRIPGRLWITYYDGRPGQTADSYLVGKGLGWTSNHVGTGCAYAIIEAWWDSDNQTTPPSITFEMEGAKLYDRRKDTTAGGSGSHRANDPSTWEVSSNPAVALDHYLLGRYTGSIKTFGVGLDADDVPYAEFAALANLCDEDVAKKAGGTHKRYAANGFLFADRTYADTIRDLCRAMNARPADFGGRIGIISGEEKTPVLTITDDDVIESVPEAYTPKRSWADLVSVVRGTYQNPAQLYQAGEYPRITDAAWTAADGGSPKEATLDLEMETDVERAQRLATLFALRERRQAQLSGTYSLRTIELEQGDWFTRTGGIFGAGKTFEVIDRVLDPRTMTVTLTAFEVDPADSAWDEADAIDPLPAPIPSTDELEPMEVPSLTVTGITLTGTAAQLPAIKVEWTEPVDTRVQQIVIEAVPAAGGVPTSAQVDWATGEVVFTNGITDDTDYLVRAKFVGDFIPSEWTSNFAVTTLGDYAVGVASSVPWSGVTGAGRPADNATVGARAGTNLFRTDGVTVLTQPDVRTAEGTAAAIAGQGPGATAVAADVMNDELRTSSLFNARLPDRPSVAADFTGSTGSGTPSSIAALATGSIVNVANEGDVRQFTNNTLLSHRGWLPIISGATYRIRVRARVTVNGTNNQLFAQFVSYTASGTVLSAHSSTALETDFVAADGWIERELTITGAAILAAQPTAAFVRARAAGGRNTGGTYSGATWQAAWLRLEDATDAIRFATVETGANVTETRTAAAIAGQGWGATASEIAASNDNLRPELWADVAHVWTWASGTSESFNIQGGATASYPAGGGIQLTAPASPSAPDVYVRTPALTLNGALYTKILVDLECISGAGGTNDLTIYWQTSLRAAESASFRDQPRNAAAFANGERRILVYDMESPLAGGTEWITSTITRIRFDLPQNASSVYRIHSIRVLRASSAEAQRLLSTVDENADVTAANTAAAIAGQGSGATASSLAALNATDNANLTQSLSTSKRLIVSDFSADGRHWTTAFGGTPEAVADPNAEGYADVANVGRVIRFNAFARYLTPKGAFTPVPGRRYAVIARVRTETAPSGGAITFQVSSINGLTTAWAHGDAAPSLSAIPGMNSTESPAAGTWVLVGRVFTMNASPNSFNAFWRPRLDITATGTGGRAEVSNFIIFDVTDVPLGRILTGLLRADGVTAVTEAAVITSLGTAAAITGQGALATLPRVTLGTGGLVRREDGATNVTDSTAITALGTAAAITGQGNGATANHQRGATFLGTPTEGSTWADTSTNTYKLYTGGAWQVVASIGNQAITITRTNGFVKTRIGAGTITSDSVSFSSSGGSGTGYTYAHELFVTSTTGPTPTISSASGSPITASASGAVPGDEVRGFVQTTVTDSLGNKATLLSPVALFCES